MKFVKSIANWPLAMTFGVIWPSQKPENDDTFDVVLNNYMFDLIPEEDFIRVLTEFRRVLKPGGKLVLASMTQGQNWFNNIWEKLYQIDPALLGGCRGVNLQPYVDSAGFKDLHREYISSATAS